MPPAPNAPIITRWTSCQHCKGKVFRLDLSFQHGQFMRFECKGCLKELHIKPDLKISRPPMSHQLIADVNGKNPRLDPLSNIHAHIDWVVLPVVEDRLNPRKPLTEMANMVGQVKTFLDDSRLTRREQMAVLQTLAKDLLDETTDDDETLEMTPDGTKH